MWMTSLVVVLTGALLLAALFRLERRMNQRFDELLARLPSLAAEAEIRVLTARIDLQRQEIRLLRRAVRRTLQRLEEAAGLTGASGSRVVCRGARPGAAGHGTPRRAPATVAPRACRGAARARPPRQPAAG